MRRDPRIERRGRYSKGPTRNAQQRLRESLDRPLTETERADVERLFPLARKIARRFSWRDPDELLSFLMIVLCRAVLSYRPGAGRLESWVFGKLQFAVIDWRRDLFHRRGLGETRTDHEPSYEESEDPRFWLDDAVLESSEEVAAILASMSDQEREAVQATVLDGETWKSHLASKKVSRRTLNLWLESARAKIKKRIDSLS